jgi:signal transduction histidine kinase
MKMKLYLVVLCASATFYTRLCGQPFISADSARTLYQSKQADTARLRGAVELMANLALRSPRETLEIGEAARNLAKSSTDSLAVAQLWRFAGLAHNSLGNRDSAILYYLQAAQLLERKNAGIPLAWVYNDIARFYRRGEYDRAIDFYNKAMAIFKNNNHLEGIATIYNESGVVYELQGKLDEALKRYEASLDIQKKRRDTTGISYSLSFISSIYLQQGKAKEAEQLALEVLQLRQTQSDSFALAVALTNLGELYTQTNNSEKAIDYFLQSNALAKGISYADIMRYNYEQLAQLYRKKGNFSQAFAMLEQGNTLKDSIYQVEKQKQIEEMAAKYEAAKKEQQIQQQKFELSRKNILLFFAAGLLVLGVFAAYNYNRRFKLQKEKEMQQQLMQQREAASKAVMDAEENERRRIAAELHDGVGQLMSAAKMNLSAFETELQGLPSDKKLRFEKIIDLVDEGCREVRAVSHEMMPNALLKRGLAAAVREFIEKIDSRVIKVNLYTEGLGERLESNVETMIYRVIQECVNNVIKHSGATLLDISLTKETNELTLTVEDNGRGFDTSKKDVFEGIGLRNIISRVEFLKGNAEFDSEPGRGTVVAVYVPLS